MVQGESTQQGTIRTQHREAKHVALIIRAPSSNKMAKSL